MSSAISGGGLSVISALAYLSLRCYWTCLLLDTVFSVPLSLWPFLPQSFAGPVSSAFGLRPSLTPLTLQGQVWLGCGLSSMTISVPWTPSTPF